MKKESKTGEDGINHTAQVGPGDRGRKKKNGFDLDLLSKTYLPARASEEGNVIGSVCIYIYIYMCVYKKKL